MIGIPGCFRRAAHGITQRRELLPSQTQPAVEIAHVQARALLVETVLLFTRPAPALLVLRAGPSARELLLHQRRCRGVRWIAVTVLNPIGDS